MAEPAWKTIITEELLKELEFDLPKPEDQDDADYEVIATLTIPAAYNHARLVASKANPEQLYLIFVDEEIDWLRVPVEPSEEGLRKLHSQYVEPAMSFAKPRVGQSMLVHTAYLRQATGKLNLGEGTKKLRWLIGYGDFVETMANMEDACTMSSFLDGAALRQATGSDETYSQFSTAFSGSLVTLERIRVGESEAYFILEIEYAPIEGSYADESVEKRAEHTPELPSDVPLDIVGFFEKMHFGNLLTADALLALVQAGDAGEVMPYAFTLNYDDFEESFLKLASHESQEVRTEVAYFATVRQIKEIYDIAKAKGISDAMVERGKNVWPD